MDEAYTVRLECLRIVGDARARGALPLEERFEDQARSLAEVVFGTRDAEIVDAARTFAETVMARS